MSYAASDYQHNFRDYSDAPPVPNGKQHSQSQYSIMNDEHLRSSRSFVNEEASSSASSYDPYRPSRYRMTPEPNGYTKVTVHRRGESNGTRKAHMQHSLRHTHANRVEALRRGGRNPSSSSLGKQSTHRKSMSRSSLARTSMSRHSIVSSVWPSSPPVAMPVRAVTSHKRGVSFSHLRQSSTTNALPAKESSSIPPITPELQAKARFSQQLHSSPNVDGHPSPSKRAETIVRSRKEKTAGPGMKSRARKSSTPSQFIKGDIRKASSELEKACEEAFFRSSISSSDYTAATATDQHAPYDTPPSSVSNRGSGYSKNGRPLPAPPVETPNTFIARTLEETRIKLAARSAAEGGTYNSARFEEVLATLDKFIPGSAEAEAEARRITSAPVAKPVDSKGLLPIISEEARHDHGQNRHSAARREYRSVTAPVYNDVEQQPRDIRTVRMVQQSSPMPPPMARRHTENPTSRHGKDSANDTTYLSVPGNDPQILRKKSNDSIDTLRKITSQDSAPSEGPALTKKKSSWFRRRKEPQPDVEDFQPQARTPQPWDHIDDRAASKTAKPNVLVRDRQPPHLNLSQAPIAGPKSASEESKGFSKWFGSWSQKKDHERSPGTAQSNQSFFSTSPPSPLPPTTPASATEPAARSWFARFLRLRPETRTLAYTVPRARARTELFRLLREWQRHGIRDLVYLPQENTITARVDKINTLDIKPVAFRIELFVVLQNGKKAGLSLARCEQVRGAASSFRKVVEVLESVCREKGLLIEDEKQWKELCEIVN